ncbi:MAG: TRAP transporter small permease [Rhodospirillaceae bacterium]|jgi:TRAP-type C4-dicarboxylate transport system permease small subunit
MLQKTIRAFALFSGFVLFGLMLITVYSVVMRYAFNAPPLFTLDLSRMMLIPVAVTGLAYCGWTSGHIAVDLIGTFGRPKLVRMSDIVVRCLCAWMVGLWTYKLIDLAIDSQEVGNATNMVQIPHYPFVWIMVASCGLFAIVFIGLMIRSIKGKEDPRTS